MNPIGACPLGFGHLLTQARKVRRENGRGKFHGIFDHIPGSSLLQLSNRCVMRESAIRSLSDTPVRLSCWWTHRRCSEQIHPAERCTRHRIAEQTTPRPALAKNWLRCRDSCAGGCCLLAVNNHPTEQPPLRPWDD